MEQFTRREREQKKKTWPVYMNFLAPETQSVHADVSWDKDANGPLICIH